MAHLAFEWGSHFRWPGRCTRRCSTCHLPPGRRWWRCPGWTTPMTSSRLGSMWSCWFSDGWYAQYTPSTSWKRRAERKSSNFFRVIYFLKVTLRAESRQICLISVHCYWYPFVDFRIQIVRYPKHKFPFRQLGNMCMEKIKNLMIICQVFASMLNINETRATAQTTWMPLDSHVITKNHQKNSAVETGVLYSSLQPNLILIHWIF